MEKCKIQHKSTLNSANVAKPVELANKKEINLLN